MDKIPNRSTPSRQTQVRSAAAEGEVNGLEVPSDGKNQGKKGRISWFIPFYTTSLWLKLWLFNHRKRRKAILKAILRKPISLSGHWFGTFL